MAAIKLVNDRRDVFNYLRGTLNFVILPAVWLIEAILLIVDGNGQFVDSGPRWWIALNVYLKFKPRNSFSSSLCAIKFSHGQVIFCFVINQNR